MKNKNIILTSITALTLIVPALADPVTPNIAVGTNPADCTEPVLGTTSGTSNLQANWTANTLNLEWTAPDADGWSTQNNTCTYDSGITVPQTNPSRTGYTFAGWKVKVAQNNNNNNQTPITLSSLYDSGSINTFSSKSLNPGVYCVGMDNGDLYGTDQGGSCSDSAFSGLNNGEWTVTMPNGNKVKGIARCSTVEGSYAQTGNPTDDLDLSNGAIYCWCQATAGDTGSGYQSVAFSSWILRDDYTNTARCADRCAYDCANRVHDFGDFRRAVFGVTQ